MKTKSIFVNSVLIISGGIALIIGSGLFFFPVTFQSSAGIILANDPGLLSETRGPGGMILASGLIMIAGAFTDRLKFTALISCMVLYGAYGIARALSIAIDGIPSSTIVMAMISEFIIGAIALAAFFRFRKHAL